MQEPPREEEEKHRPQLVGMATPPRLRSPAQYQLQNGREGGLGELELGGNSFFRNEDDDQQSDGNDGEQEEGKRNGEEKVESVDGDQEEGRGVWGAKNRKTIAKLRGALRQRALLIEHLRSAYLRDVTVLKNEVEKHQSSAPPSKEVKGEEKENPLDLLATPSVDLRSVLLVHAPGGGDSFLNVGGCETCGGPVEVIYRATQELMELQRRYDSLQDTCEDLRGNLAVSNAQRDKATQALRETVEMSGDSQSALMQKVIALKRDLGRSVPPEKLREAEEEAQGLRTKLRAAERQGKDALALREERDVLKHALRETGDSLREQGTRCWQLDRELAEARAATEDAVREMGVAVAVTHQLRSDVEGMRGERDAARQARRDMEQQLEEKLAKNSAMLEESKLRELELESQVRALKDELVEAAAGGDQEEAEAGAGQQVLRLEKLLAEEKQELRMSRAQLVEMRLAVEVAEEKTSRAQAEASAADRYQAESAALKSAVVEMEARVSALRADLAKAKTEVATLAAEAEELRKERESAAACMIIPERIAGAGTAAEVLLEGDPNQPESLVNLQHKEDGEEEGREEATLIVQGSDVVSSNSSEVYPSEKRDAEVAAASQQLLEMERQQKRALVLELKSWKARHREADERCRDMAKDYKQALDALAAMRARLREEEQSAARGEEEAHTCSDDDDDDAFGSEEHEDLHDEDDAGGREGEAMGGEDGHAALPSRGISSERKASTRKSRASLAARGSTSDKERRRISSAIAKSEAARQAAAEAERQAVANLHAVEARAQSLESSLALSREQIQSLTDAKEALRSQLVEQKDSNARLAGELDVARGAAQSLQAAIETLQQQASLSESLLSQSRADLSLAQEEVSTLRNVERKLNADLSATKDRERAVIQELDKRKTSEKEAKRELSAMRAEAKKAKMGLCETILDLRASFLKLEADGVMRSKPPEESGPVPFRLRPVLALLTAAEDGSDAGKTVEERRERVLQELQDLRAPVLRSWIAHVIQEGEGNLRMRGTGLMQEVERLSKALASDGEELALSRVKVLDLQEKYDAQAAEAEVLRSNLRDEQQIRAQEIRELQVFQGEHDALLQEHKSLTDDAAHLRSEVERQAQDELRLTEDLKALEIKFQGAQAAGEVASLQRKEAANACVEMEGQLAEMSGHLRALEEERNRELEMRERRDSKGTCMDYGCFSEERGTQTAFLSADFTLRRRGSNVFAAPVTSCTPSTAPSSSFAPYCCYSAGNNVGQLPLLNKKSPNFHRHSCTAMATAAASRSASTGTGASSTASLFVPQLQQQQRQLRWH
jgi:colicin import membrane protein